jgi:phosphatidylserine/phosphatidylglycerophosphate/cardiolipin synthase-like enzyme
MANNEIQEPSSLSVSNGSDASKQKLTDEFLSSQRSMTGASAASSDNSTSTGIPKISDAAPHITGYMEQPGNGENIVKHAIENAHQSVNMWMFHLSDPSAAQSLIAAHDQNHADVQVILDKNNLAKDPNASRLADQMKADGITVVPSSDAFTITHPKTFVIDGKTSYITSMNLTRALPHFRDFGISTDDPMIANDLDRLFQADLKNSAGNTKDTPAPVSPFLLVSPIVDAPDASALSVDQQNIDAALSGYSDIQKSAAQADFGKASKEFSPDQQLAAERDLSQMQNGDQLVQLFAQKMQDENIDRIAGIFDRAQTKVVGETENIGAPDVLNSIINAAKRGVEVDLVIPGNSLGNVAKNSQAVSQLEAASADIEKQGLPGIHIKEMPPIGNGGQSLPNPDQPYVHAKWLVADENKEAYLGSVNFTPNSLYAAREIGLIFEDSPTMQKMVTAFNKDWNAAQLPPDQQN